MANEEDEPNLVERAGRGDAEAFTVLFHRYHSMIHAFAYRLSLDATEADEIAQETFIKAARAIGSLRGSLRGWLYGIARNCATDSARRRIRRERLAAVVAGHEATRREERTSDHDGVREALATLAPDLREAVVLTFYEAMSHAEAARIAGCAEATISWRVFMAKRKLRAHLSRPEP